MDFKNLFYAVLVILLLIVAYATFWILVITLVGYTLYHVISFIRDDTS